MINYDELRKKLKCPETWNDPYDPESILQNSNEDETCTCNDGFLCKHRLEILIKYLKEQEAKN